MVFHPTHQHYVSLNSFNLKYNISSEASDGDFLLESESDENDDDIEFTNATPEVTTRGLVEKANRAGNIQNSQTTTSTINNKHPHTRKRRSNESGSEVPDTDEFPKKKLRNSDLFPSSVRPD